VLTKLMDMFVTAILDPQESTAKLVSASFIFETSVSILSRIFIKCLGISSLDFLKNSLHVFYCDSEIKRKPIATCTFLRASRLAPRASRLAPRASRLAPCARQILLQV